MKVRQLTAGGKLRHLLTLEGVPITVIRHLFALADRYAAGHRSRPLSGQLIVNIFFESSTRTRTAFEATAKQLGADVVNLDRIGMAGETKQESLPDTVRTVAAMGAAGIVLRHSDDGAADIAAAAVPTGVAVVNGGDGCRAHPTQALADVYTLCERFGANIAGLSVAIIGDVLHSRVARSNVHILRTFGVKDIRLVGPPALCPPQLAETLGATVTHDMEAGIEQADVVLLLRVQRERLNETPFYTSAQRYFADYGLNRKRLRQLRKEAVIMHPGPINRGVEIADEVADGKHSLILRQVTNGMAIRAAVLAELCGKIER